MRTLVVVVATLAVCTVGCTHATRPEAPDTERADDAARTRVTTLPPAAAVRQPVPVLGR